MGPSETAVVEAFSRLDPEGLFAVHREAAAAAGRIIDDPDKVGAHARAISVQIDALKVLEPRKTKSRGRLHVVSQMSAKYRTEQAQ